MISTHFFLFKEIPPFMKPLDQFKRTPPRRYDQAPPPPPEEKRTLEPAIRKRYFEIPAFRRGRMDKLLGGAFAPVMLLTLCNASAPMNDVPGVQERFTQWAAVQNEKTVQRLPGLDAEPDSTWAAAAGLRSRSGKTGGQAEAKEERSSQKPKPRREPRRTSRRRIPQRALSCMNRVSCIMRMTA